MSSQVEMGRFEMLRAKWEAQQQESSKPDNTTAPLATPGRTPVHQRRFYSSSTELRDSKVRRFSSFAAFTSPINPFSRRDRSGMPFPKSPSSNALVVAGDRQDPPPPLKRRPTSRLPSFKSSSNSMAPPPLPAPKPNYHGPEQRTFGGRLPKSQTTSDLPLMASSTPGRPMASLVKRPPSGIPSRKATGLKQPSQSTSNLIRSRPPTPHRSADAPLPTAVQSTNNLFSLNFSSSSNNMRSKLPTPAVAKDPRQPGVATKMFAGMTKMPKTNTKRSYTQPNLPSTAGMAIQPATPRKTVFREEFATRTPRYMTSENSKPAFLLPPKSTRAIDDFFGPESGPDIPEDLDDEELRRWGVVGDEAWNSPRVVKTPPTVKPRRTSGARPSQLPRLYSTGNITQQGLLAPLSPPYPRTPRHCTAHSQSLGPPGSGISRPNILRDSHLSPCPEVDSHSGPHHRSPKTAIRFPPTGYPRAYSPPTSPSPVPSSPSPPPSPTPTHASPYTVWAAEPHGYWAGRFTALFDRLRLDAFHAEGRVFRLTGCVSDTFGAFVDGGEEQRARRVFGELAACCRSEDAARSLRDFQRVWAEKTGSVVCMPPAAVIVLGNTASGQGGEEGGKNEEGLRGGGGDGKSRKTAGIGFMERLKEIAREARKASF